MSQNANHTSQQYIESNEIHSRLLNHTRLLHSNLSSHQQFVWLNGSSYRASLATFEIRLSLSCPLPVRNRLHPPYIDTRAIAPLEASHLSAPSTRNIDKQHTAVTPLHSAPHRLHDALTCVLHRPRVATQRHCNARSSTRFVLLTSAAAACVVCATGSLD